MQGLNLYHYTSIQALVLLLKNNALRFSSLEVVDDIEEGDTSDYGKFGRFTFVSCWTRSPSEVIPLWSMYTPNMDGVRIGIKNTDALWQMQPTKIDRQTVNFLASLHPDILDPHHLTEMPPYAPHLIDINYTDDEQSLRPAIRAKKAASYNWAGLGETKSNAWTFQHESRFLFRLMPASVAELRSHYANSENTSELDERFKSFELPIKSLDIKLTQRFFEGMEVVLGPKVNEAQAEIVNLSVEKYAPNTIIRHSALKIR